MGVAQYALGDLDQATKTFEEAVRTNDDDVESWLHLGKCYLYKLKLPNAAAALEVAVLQKGAIREIHSLFKARNWMANWQDREELLERIERSVGDDLQAGIPPGVNALDFAELPPRMVLALSRQAQANAPGGVNRSLCCDAKDLRLQTPRLRIGFVSSDFGVHPVATLMRGILALLSGPDRHATVYCYSLTAASSWWKRNISRHVDHMVSLVGKNPSEAATIIRSHQIHVLIDLNGHTLHSGLSIFNYRPSPVQMSFLGYPMTTGSAAIDYFVSDGISTPAESSGSIFTEKLLLLPTHYIVNDHLQMLGHTIEGDKPLLPHVNGDTSVFVFATFSNWQKIDPNVFRAWMDIMARVPSSVLWFLRYSGHEDAEKSLKREANAHGIDGDKRLVFSDLAPWVNHTYPKRAADLVLDTTLKNGHTTMIDALCAGVPVVTMEGNRMSNRAGSSALHSLDLHDLTVNSFKEYVEVAVFLATHPHVLHRLRTKIERNRLQYPLFDTRKYTRNFANAVKATWTVKKAARVATRESEAKAFHIFPAGRLDQIAPRQFPVHSALGDGNKDDEYVLKVHRALDTNQAILLHIGGQVEKPGWWIVDANERSSVDFQIHMDNLYPFPDDSVAAIYASHILEHSHYRLNSEVERTLQEWFRVLRPGGALFVSVPDLLVLSSLFANATTTDNERFFVMMMMYGGQVDSYDVHKVGFFESLLAEYLGNTGFCEIERVDNFGLFPDSSAMVYKDVPISLNVKARACRKPGERIDVDLSPEAATQT